ncbi:MAG: ROK family transcriptional regulator [Hyphomicrobiales bacterium]
MILSGTNLDHGQRFNRRVVLETVRVRQAISRAEIARLTGLSAQTVSNIAEALLRADLLVEKRVHDGRRGQPPVNLAINPEGGFSIGISFDHRRIAGVLVDLAGRLRQKTEIAIDEADPELVLRLIEGVVRALARPRGTRRGPMLGVGIVAPALFESGSLIALGPSSMQQWQGFPLEERLAARFDLPVFVDNDATAAAIGERLYGAGRTLRHFFYIYFGVGLGGGMVLSGNPYRGGHMRAGELGHVVVEPGGRPCPCGNRGCLERYASLSSAQAAMTGRPEGAVPVDPDRLAKAHAAGNSRLLAWLDDAAMHLRQAIIGIENLLDPQTIIIGGILPETLLDDLVTRIEPLPRSVAAERRDALPRLMKATAGIDTPALGAASLAIFDATTADYTMLFKRTAEPRRGSA